MATPTIQEANGAKVAQAVKIVEHLQAVREQIAAMATAEMGGAQLWIGGLPPVLTQLDGMIQHNIGALKVTFGLAAEAGQ